MRVKIRDVGGYSIYVSESTASSHLNFVFLLLAFAGAIVVGLSSLNHLSWGSVIGCMVICIGIIFTGISPFKRKTYVISDTCRYFNVDHIDETGDDEKDNKEICKVAQRREKEIRAMLDREERLKKMAENCKELGAES